MNAKTLIAIASVAAAFSGVARAGEADLFANASQFHGERARAEVQAEAVQAATAQRAGEADVFASCTQAAAATRDAAVVKAEAVQAVRLGQVRIGEAS